MHIKKLLHRRDIHMENMGIKRYAHKRNMRTNGTYIWKNFYIEDIHINRDTHKKDMYTEKIYIWRDI